MPWAFLGALSSGLDGKAWIGTQGLAMGGGRLACAWGRVLECHDAKRRLALTVEGGVVGGWGLATALEVADYAALIRPT